jgi:hypothetical protein
VNDDAGRPFQHSRKERAIEANGGEKVGVYGLLPIVIAKSEYASARCAGAADIVDEDVETAKTVLHFPGSFFRALGRADVGLYEQYSSHAFRQRRACRGGHLRAACSEAAHDGLAHAFGSARDEGALAGEFGRIGRKPHRGIHG